MYKILFWKQRYTPCFKKKICFYEPLFIQTTFFIWVFPLEPVQLLSIVSRASFRCDSCKQSWQSRKEKVETLLWSQSGSVLQSVMNLIFMHTPETSFMPHVLMAKDIIASLSNAALVILVTSSALIQLSSFSQNISDSAFPDYIIMISFRKWQENW